MSLTRVSVTFVHRHWFVIGVMLFVTAVSTVIMQAPKVHAQQYTEGCPNRSAFGRKLCDGYFTGTRNTADPNPSNAVFYNGLRKFGTRSWVSNVNDYIAVMGGYLYDDDNRMNPDYGSNDPAVLSVQNSDARRNNVGAAHHIDVMLGKDGPDFGGSTDAGIKYARDNFLRWAMLMRNYDSRGQIQFKVASVTLGSDDDRITHSTGQPPNNNDNEFFSSPYYITQSVRINDGSGKPMFQIEMDCGNIFGIVTALTNPAGGDINPPTPGDASNPPGYNDGDSNIYSSCTKISGHAFDPNTPGYAVPVSVTYKIGGNTIATDNGITASTSGAHLWTADTPSAVRTSVQPVTVSGTYKLQDGSTGTLSGSPITIGPCLKPAPNCSGATWSPSSIDPSTPYTITANIRYSTDVETDAVMARPDTRFFITVSGPGVNTVLTYTAGQISRSGLLLTVTTPQQSPTNQSGTYKVGYGISGSFGAINCGAANATDTNPPAFVVANKPFFSVKNGDISAGAGMSVNGSECAAGGVPKNDNAGIVGWNRGGAFGYGGAGSQYGALALGHLQDFATGQGSSLTPSGASFANSGGDADQVNIGQGMFGGEFAGANCTGDYFKDVPNSQIQGSQTIGGIAVPNCDGTNDAQCRRVLYIKGDLYINGNITFSGNYPTTSAIPAFSVVVKGNIYIAPGVTRLDGFYIAQPNDGTSTNGVIYTCAPSPSIAAALDATLATTCGNALTVNGAFVARQVWLLRAAGTVSTTPAETINYSPELWLSAPFGNKLTPVDLGGYDAITSLPPVL